MPGFWSIIDRDAESERQAALGRDFSSWLQENGIRKHASRISLRRFWQGQQDLVEAPPPGEQEYTKRLSNSTGHVLIADDKDKKRTESIMPFGLVHLMPLEHCTHLSTAAQGIDIRGLVACRPSFLRERPFAEGLFCTLHASICQI